MARRRRIYEGKAKILFEGPEPGTLVQYFKDDATAFNNKKQGVKLKTFGDLQNIQTFDRYGFFVSDRRYRYCPKKLSR